MIDPKSLRIGNYLQGDPLNIPKWGISSDGIVQITAHGIYLLDEMHREGKELPYKPIPLSEQELIRLGWESIGELHPTFKLWNYLLEEDMLRTGKYFLRQILNKEDSLCISGEILYVHELQNIFRDLKRKELQYKVDSGLTPTEPDTKEPVYVAHVMEDGSNNPLIVQKNQVIGSNGIINGEYKEDPGK